MDKTTLRKIALKRREEIIKTKEKTTEITKKVMELNKYQEAKTIFVYLSLPQEQNTDLLIERALKDGKEVAVPMVEGKQMKAILLTKRTKLIKNKWGIREPQGGVEVPPCDIDLVITPGLLFDEAGYRLGYGGGYYDRFFLEGLSAYRVGYCYREQRVEELPRDTWDIPVDVVVSS